MMRLTVGFIGTLALSGVALAQNAAVMSPVRPMPRLPNASPYGNILFPGGTPQTHAGRLGATVAGAPIYTGYGGRGGGRSVVVPYAVPLFVDGYGAGGGWGYAPQQQQPVTVVVPQQPAPQVIINHHYSSADASGPTVTAETPSPRGEMQVYEASPRRPQPVRSAVDGGATYVRDEKPNVYMIVLKDDTKVREAIGYWVKGDTLHYVTPEASINHVSLARVDRDASRQLNQQRKLELELPAN
ncbi:MAG TPA: hypothetical protein VES20_21475 [Bryobacteraceae bacterium]|nr:hypothetical protein [Bryobacteraceae bacterium]